ncbi:hypothetical protein bpmyx0001_43910 [Bacillus pseudomycoides DSM 12442]|nr:hypothetical protein bpmyx0001_43910 [Bacillus pseudomycoides DSM 12442]
MYNKKKSGQTVLICMFENQYVDKKTIETRSFRLERASADG